MKVGRGKKWGTQSKTTPKATIKPTTVDFYWAAGFLEGEGYFGYNHGSGYVRVGQIQREPLERLQKIFGGSIGESKTPLGKPFLYWDITGSRARGIMMTLYGIMSPRRQEQIRKALVVSV